MKRESWCLPKPTKSNPEKGGFCKARDGEPFFVRLRRYENDKTLSGSKSSQCCDCGLVHQHTYNVLLAPDGEWYVIIRSYRMPGTAKKNRARAALKEGDA